MKQVPTIRSEIILLICILIYYSERATHPVWYFNPPESHRLTEQNIDDFVNCLKECAFISIFNKNDLELAAETCHYLSQLRPELIVPPLVELLVFSLPHYFYNFLTVLFLDFFLLLII